MDASIITQNGKTTFSNKLAENNALLNDWKKTNDTKDKLRLLEISAKTSEE